MSKRSQNKNLSAVGQPQSSHLEMATISTVYSGPVPDASQLEKYGRICRGAADRIIAHLYLVISPLSCPVWVFFVSPEKFSYCVIILICLVASS